MAMTEDTPIVDETPTDESNISDVKVQEDVSFDAVRERAIAKIEAKMSGKEIEDAPAPKAKQPVPEDDDIDWDSLAERSIAVGMSDEDLEEFDDPKALDKALRLLEKNRSADKSRDEAGPIVSDDDLDLEDEWLDEEARERVRVIRDKYESHVSQLRRELETLRSEVTKNNELAEARRFDTALSDLGKAYEKVFGSGATADLDRKSDAFKNRTALRDEMATIAAGLEARGKSVPEEAELFKKALRSAFGDDMHKIEKSRLQAKISKRQSQMSVSPAPRNVGSHTPVTNSDQAIINKIANKMHQLGMASY